MAYASDESGEIQVYVRPYPGPDRKWLVSTRTATYPLWNRIGRELFYRSGDQMLVVEVSTGPDLALSPPRVLFEQRYSTGSGASISHFDISPDGERFVMVKDDAAGRLNVVLNWIEELKARVPTN
jgi:hypothetical protein